MHSVAALGAHRHAARTKHLAAAAVAPAGGDTGARAPSCPRPCRSRTRASLPALHVAFRANAPRRSSATTAASRICRARVVTRPRAGTAPSARTGGSHTCAPSTALTPGANAPVCYRMLRLFKSCSRCAHAPGTRWWGSLARASKPACAPAAGCGRAGRDNATPCARARSAHPRSPVCELQRPSRAQNTAVTAASSLPRAHGNHGAAQRTPRSRCLPGARCVTMPRSLTLRAQYRSSMHPHDRRGPHNSQQPKTFFL